MISAQRDMFAVGAITLLCLVSVSRSAPPACEDLVRPLDHPDLRHLEGRWAFIAGSLNSLQFIELLRGNYSATATFSSNANDTNFTMRRSKRPNNDCYSQSYNISLEGSSFTFENGSVNITFIHTSCHDCILMHMDVESGDLQYLYLFSRRRQLEENELEEFRAQVKCLNMPPPVVMDPTVELCSEAPAGHQAAQTEQKTEGQKD